MFFVIVRVSSAIREAEARVIREPDPVASSGALVSHLHGKPEPKPVLVIFHYSNRRAISIVVGVYLLVIIYRSPYLLVAISHIRP